MNPNGWTTKQVVKRIGALEDAYGGILNLAVKLGVAYTTVYRWKTGRALPFSLARSRIEALERSAARVSVKK